jgi:hypothetical protein
VVAVSLGRVEQDMDDGVTREVNVHRIAEIEQQVYGTNAGNETVHTPLAHDFFSAFSRGLAINPQPYLLLLSVVRWVLLSLVIANAVNHQNCVNSYSTEFDKAWNCDGYQFGAVACGMASAFFLIVDIAVSMKYVSQLGNGSMKQVQQYVSDMCCSPPKLFYTAECYHNTSDSDGSSHKRVTHFVSRQFQFQSYSDHTVIPPNLTEYDFVKIHGVIEYTFAIPALANRFAYEKETFFNEHLHCDTHRNCKVNTTIGIDFTSVKVCYLRSDATLPATMNYRQSIHLLCTLLCANWLYVVYEEGLFGHIHVVFKKEIIS